VRVCDVARILSGIEHGETAAAGGVLISAIGSVVIGLLVLGPPLLQFLIGLF
jgi:hypothetical protein